MTVSRKKNIDLNTTADAKTGSDTPVATSAVLSEAIPSPFESTQDSKFHIANFIENYTQIEKVQSKVYEVVEKYNELLIPPLEKDELLKLFNEVLAIKTVTLSFSDLMSQEFPKARLDRKSVV